jgi:hypothetical protein
VHETHVVMSHILHNSIYFIERLRNISKILSQVCSPSGRESNSGSSQILPVTTQPRCTVSWWKIPRKLVIFVRYEAVWEILPGLYIVLVIKLSKQYLRIKFLPLRKHCAYTSTTLMLFREIRAIYSLNHMKAHKHSV